MVRCVTIFDALPGEFVINFMPILPAGFAAIDSQFSIFVVDVNFVVIVCCGEIFLFGGVHRLKIHLLVDGESKLGRGEIVPRDDDDDDDICDVLDALFIVRR